jgi:hypothetical protein
VSGHCTYESYTVSIFSVNNPTNHPKYSIEEFAYLDQSKGFGNDVEIRFAGRIAVQYYIYACHEMFSFLETRDELFSKNLSENDPLEPVYISKAWAAALGMYMHLRTVLEATRKIREYHSKTDWPDNVHKESIRRILDTANNVVKHPMFNGAGSKAYMSEKSIDIGGTIELYEFVDLDSLATTVSLKPEGDLTTVAEYMRYLARKVAGSNLNQI